MIRRPFSRRSGPVPESHRATQAGAFCRLIVTPALQGENHGIEVVPHGESFEQALIRALERAA